MQIGETREVYFGEYCEKCLHFEKNDDEEPCCDCLEEPVAENSHKPVKFVSKNGENNAKNRRKGE